MKSGQFAFPPILDVRIDQAKTELVIDRDKAASMGLTMQQLGADLSAMLGGNFVNRFNIDGRSYKVIPQIERVGAAHARAARRHPRHRARAASSCRSRAIATLQQGVEPRTLNRFQQLNAIKISGVATRRSTGRSRCSRTPRAQILPPGYRVDYTGESRQLRAGGRQVPAGDGARAAADLPGAGGAVQFVPRSVRRSSRARCRWRCSAR